MPLLLGNARLLYNLCCEMQLTRSVAFQTALISPYCLAAIPSLLLHPCRHQCGRSALWTWTSGQPDERTSKQPNMCWTYCLPRLPVMFPCMKARAGEASGCPLMDLHKGSEGVG